MSRLWAGALVLLLATAAGCSEEKRGSAPAGALVEAAGRGDEEAVRDAIRRHNGTTALGRSSGPAGTFNGD